MTYRSIINAEELLDMLGREKLAIVDCRHILDDTEAGWQDYLQSHIPGAYYAHLERDLSGEIILGKTGRHPMPEMEMFAKKCGQWGIDKQTQVVVYDQGSGGIAARLWFLLKWAGHENVAVLNGGWNFWQKMSFPVSAIIPKPSNAIFDPKEQKGWLVSAEMVGKLNFH